MSQFGADKFTTRAREAIEAAQLSATTAGNSTTEPIHLLVALLRQQEGTARTMVTKAGVDAAVLTSQAESALEALPRASGATVRQPAASAALTRVLAGALDLAAGMKDDYVATEHLLIAIAGVQSPAQKLLTDAGLTEAGLRDSLTGVRGNRRVTSETFGTLSLKALVADVGSPAAVKRGLNAETPAPGLSSPAGSPR